MKIQPDTTDKLSITSYSDAWISVNGQTYPHSLFVSSAGEIQPWSSASLDNMGSKEFNFLLESNCEILIWGTWGKPKFPSQQVLMSFSKQGIGVESMDTAAACRTFNILANEGRKVCAILLLADSAIA